CGEGKYWEEPPRPLNVYAFAKNTESLVVPASETAPSSFDVTIRRNNPTDEVVLPLTFEEVDGQGNPVSLEVLSGPSEVVFEKGSLTATYTISIDNEMIVGGSNYSATITIDPTNATEYETQIKEDSDNLIFTFSISQAINWVSAGTASTMSAMFENEDPVDVPVEYASNVPLANGNKLMRLVSPYWYVDPESVKSGYNLQFYVDKDNNAVSFPSWQWIGFVLQGYDFFIGCPASQGCTFTNDGATFTLEGMFAYGSGAPQAYYDYETLIFTWSDYSE
ncbi:MAG: hypothetical protein K2M10_09000, partial [Muribaculaceae bacterium]|nr:hypothetical protein [Muribaculaceae bacterium]